MLSIIIPTHNKASRLRLALRVLAEAVRHSPVPCEIVVVNDGSGDDTLAVLTAAQGNMVCSFQIVHRDIPGGRSVARNLGAAAATGERLLFLDDDMLISTAVLERHYSLHHEREPRIGRATILNLPWLRAAADPTKRCEEMPDGIAKRLICAATIDSIIDSVAPLARRSRFEADLHRLLANRSSTMAGRWLAATGGNLSVSHEFFTQVGGFDECMGLRWGAEDLEFGFRAEKAGARMLHLDDVVTYHMDHELANREVDHQIALRYFSKKHGTEVGQRLAAYFAGNLDILAVVE